MDDDEGDRGAPRQHNESRRHPAAAHCPSCFQEPSGRVWHVVSTLAVQGHPVCPSFCPCSSLAPAQRFRKGPGAAGGPGGVHGDPVGAGPSLPAPRPNPPARLSPSTPPLGSGPPLPAGYRDPERESGRTAAPGTRPREAAVRASEGRKKQRLAVPRAPFGQPVARSRPSCFRTPHGTWWCPSERPRPRGHLTRTAQPSQAVPPPSHPCPWARPPTACWRQERERLRAGTGHSEGGLAGSRLPSAPEFHRRPLAAPERRRGRRQH